MNLFESILKENRKFSKSKKRLKESALKEMSRNKLDALEFLYNNDFFDIVYDRRGKEITDIRYSMDEVEDYIDNGILSEEDVKSFADYLYNIKFYSEDGRESFVELSDHHTLWDVENPNINDYQYAELVDKYGDEFEVETGVSPYLLGRMGRHVCVEDNFDNILNYDYLCEVQQRLEREMIDEINLSYVVEENKKKKVKESAEKDLMGKWVTITHPNDKNKTIEVNVISVDPETDKVKVLTHWGKTVYVDKDLIEKGKVVEESKKKVKESAEKDFLWDSWGNGKYRVVYKNQECDVYSDWKHKGKYIIDRIEGKRISNAQNLTKAETKKFIKDYVDNGSINESKKVVKEGYKLTEIGKKKVNSYIRELKAKRKEILDAGKDTADETNLPTIEDIEADIDFQGIDDEDEYYNSWGVTDHYDADYPISLKLGIDFEEVIKESKNRVKESCDKLSPQEIGYLTRLYGYEYGLSLKDAQKQVKSMSPEKQCELYKILNKGFKDNARRSFYED